MASEPAATAQQQDRVLIGQLIQAADTLGARCDQLADRLERLEDLLEETVTALGGDLIAMRAALQRLGEGVRGCTTALSLSCWRPAGVSRNPSRPLFRTRALAGALSRHAKVAVVTPGESGDSGADGAFNIFRIGGQSGEWPLTARWPITLGEAAAAVVVGGAAGVRAAHS